jgi:2-methylcitrate dehydratase PrpD
VAAIDVEVDSMTPKLLIHPDPASGLQAKFSMPFCAGAALVFGRVGIDTFESPALNDASVRRLLPRVTLRGNPAFDTFAPLSQARVTVTLRDGRVLTRSADGCARLPGSAHERRVRGEVHRLRHAVADSGRRRSGVGDRE